MMKRSTTFGHMDAPLLSLTQSVIQFDVKGDEGRREEENKKGRKWCET